MNTLDIARSNFYTKDAESFDDTNGVLSHKLRVLVQHTDRPLNGILTTDRLAATLNNEIRPSCGNEPCCDFAVPNEHLTYWGTKALLCYAAIRPVLTSAAECVASVETDSSVYGCLQHNTTHYHKCYTSATTNTELVNARSDEYANYVLWNTYMTTCEDWSNCDRWSLRWSGIDVSQLGYTGRTLASDDVRWPKQLEAVYLESPVDVTYGRVEPISKYLQYTDAYGDPYTPSTLHTYLPDSNADFIEHVRLFTYPSKSDESFNTSPTNNSVHPSHRISPVPGSNIPPETELLYFYNNVTTNRSYYPLEIGAPLLIGSDKSLAQNYVSS